MADQKLTKRVVDSALPGASKRIIWDTELKGFGLRIMPSGVKTYIAMYRNEYGRQRELSIGRHGVLACEQARTMARDALYQASKGADPLEEKQEARKVLTVAGLGELYLKDGPADRPNKKQRSWDDEASLFKRHIIPLLGKKALPALKRSDVAQMQKDIADGKTATDEKTKLRGRAIVKGGKGAGARAMATLRAALSFAVRRGLIETNVAMGVPLYKSRSIERVIAREEFALLSEAMTWLVDWLQIRAAHVDAIKLLALTGCRRGEILSLQWTWLDMRRGLILFPDSKTGQKETPLPPAAIDILKQIQRTPGSPYVFPALDGGPGHMQNLKKPWERIRDKANELARERGEQWDMSDIRIHDLRHAFASWAVESGASLYLVGKVLGHRQAATTQRYAHARNDPLMQVATSTSDAIAEAMKPKG